MPWIYEQWSGRLYRPNGTEATTPNSTGYSGDFLNANYPPAQGLPFGGAIPTGFYEMG